MPGSSLGTNEDTSVENEAPFRAELLSPEQLERHACALAASHTYAQSRKSEKLLPRLRANERVIDKAYDWITEMVHTGVHVPPAGEWLLDNYYVIKEHISLAREHLPKNFSKELPLLETGPSAGFPRIYHLATELISHVDGRVDAGNLGSFIAGYHGAAALNIGELWAVPIMLRLALIENLRRVSQRVCQARTDCLLAEKWASRLVAMAEQDPKNLVLVLADMVKASLPSSSSFVAELCKRLQGQSPSLALALSWFDQRLAEQGASTEQLILAESQGQASDQVSIGNTITSLRLLSATDWRDFVERYSQMELILRRDPAGLYADMDFETRDAYRHVVEKLSKKSGADESAVAEKIVALAGAATVTEADPRPRHIGYYLIDRGLRQLEAALHCKVHTYRPAASQHPALRVAVFVTSVLLFSLALTAPLTLWLNALGLAVWVTALLSALFFVSASQAGVHLVNSIITLLLPPQRLPQMNYSKGVPDAQRTLVAIPTMLGNRKTADSLVEGLEIRYLANLDKNIYFAVLTDFPDAAQELNPGDTELLEYACKKVQALNAKYAADRAQIFYLFHRPRRWNAAEGAWMGYERKRGKLTEFNRVLREPDPEAWRALFLAIEGDKALLKSFKYVVTLDTDTQLPRNSAQRLTGAMAHLLNRPIVDAKTGRVAAGYGLLQPRVALNLSSAKSSWFVRLYAPDAGIDPYTRAVSDVYQDLFGEGSFVGKGIYDVDAFEQTCGHRFPENRILSHDLIEGCYARAGLLTDVELFEDYPPRYNADARRRHRWLRGDWQIAGWLLPWVPHAKGTSSRNTLSALSRWKIFDNLRRSMIAPCSVAVLAAAWFLAPQAAAGIGWGLIFLNLVPALYSFGRELVSKTKDVPWRMYLVSTVTSFFRSSVQAGLSLIFLAFEAYMSIDAILRTVWRVMFSRRRLLEWQTASEAEQKAATGLPGFAWEMRVTLAAVLALGVAVRVFSPVAILAAVPWLAEWLAAPIIAYLLSVQLHPQTQYLTADDRLFLREVARRTWRFFNDFVAPADNWLPPDNFQQTPHPLIASRTSPTNIGVALLSTLTALDFGFISMKTLTTRMAATLRSMSILQRYQGHFFNWYDTHNCQPLHPLYVSSVDSGNLLGHLLTLISGLAELPETPLLSQSARPLEALGDTARCLKRAIQQGLQESANAKEKAPNYDALLRGVDKLLHMLDAPRAGLAVTFAALEQAISEIEKFAALLNDPALPAEISDWTGQLREHALDLRDNALRYMPWLARKKFNPPALPGAADIFQHFEHRGSLNALLELETQLLPLVEKVLAGGALSQLERVEFENLRLEVTDGAAKARETLTELQTQSNICTGFCDMKFEFLFDRQRLLLAIGYNASEHRLDSSYYDLLASEARLVSFVCIALGLLPVKHWFMLGRKLTTSGGTPALLSWSGSMFEYLMPNLVMPCYEGSLLDQTCKSVVQWQVDYAAANGGIPWGISESGFNARDMQQHYQYRAFGVPGLGFKRGLSEDMVIAPYSSAMSVMVAPQQACSNLRHMLRLGALDIYGFYEAIDYTPSRLMKGQKFAIVRSFMAHHQGMSLLGLSAQLLDHPMQRRFKKDPRLKATDLLLQERIPHGAVPIYPHSAEEEHTESEPEDSSRSVRDFRTPNTTQPEIQLLSNGRYHVMLTNAGGGYSRWKDLELTRWREDGTCDSFGQFCYIVDRDAKRTWSPVYQPCLGPVDEYWVRFLHSSAEFRRQEAGVTSLLTVCVSPEEDVEIRQLKLANTSRHHKRLDVVTYFEVVLNPHNADLAHPAFGNLFIQTELLPEKNAVLCTRRPRTDQETPPWLFHLVTVKKKMPRGMSFETDRSKFIGRGGSVQSPSALREYKPLSNSSGSVLDPIAAIRCEIELEPAEHLELELVTGAAESRDAAINLIEKFRDHRLCERAFEVAWTHGKVVLSQLNATESDAQVYCELAGAIIHASPAHRAAQAILTRNQRGQSGLWGYGISGDFPIVLLRLGDVPGLALVREALQAHAYLRMKGLAFDLVIWNEDASTYRQSLHDALMGMVLTGPEAGTLDKPGGVFIRRGDLIAEEDRVLLQSLARVTLQEGHGRLFDQIDRYLFVESKAPALVPTRTEPPPARVLGPADDKPLQFANGLGGFSQDGREYVMRLQPGKPTPAPWCNVIANPVLGTVISESGGAYTWAENAHEFRLTPWKNDALLDPSGECFYLRDDETGRCWSPTPNPTPGKHEYNVRHGFGYSVFSTVNEGIFSELTIFVAPHEPVKFALLKVRNDSMARRKLSATGYWEWVLGENRQKNAQHIITEADNRTGAILARNAYSTDFQGRISFCAVSDRARTATCDRAEFLGRNGNTSEPAALGRTRLSGRMGGGMDPCTALQVRLDLAEGQQRQVVFLLGSGRDVSEAQSLVQRFLSVDAAQRTLERSQHNWRRTCDALQVKTPDPAIDVLVNGWLTYQVLSSRVWARSGFYQSGGAYGFRDQLQDVMALTFTAPDLTREHLLRCAAHQFEEGDVQHWWHPPSGRGVRTSFSDDFLWLPYATSRYVLTTGDTGVLSETVSFISGRALKASEEAYYDLPQRTDKAASLFEHCKRSLAHALVRMGKHGLPLMGCGDWNDGMNLVGIHGQGESVWLAFFLYDVLNQFAAVAKRTGDASTVTMCEEGARALRENIKQHAWDGKWYLRAFFDDGSPLGSASNPECQIDSLPQSWAVLSKAGDPERCKQGMDAVNQRLVNREKGLIQLFDPPFDKSNMNPGYIKAYVPGVRENGGQYSHAAVWTAMAFAEMGETERAWELLNLLNPVHHGGTKAGIDVYKVEPYVVAADVYAVAPHTGRGGWTWYTGSAGWLYRFIVESLLGVTLEVDVLHVRPRVPESWSNFSIAYRFRETLYQLSIERTQGAPELTVDGVSQQTNDRFTLKDDRAEHTVVIKFNSNTARAAARPSQRLALPLQV